MAIVVIVVAIAGFFGAAYNFHFLGLGTQDCSIRPTTAANSAYFVILLDNRGVNVGMNGSGTHIGLWPVMNVTLGEAVTIHVWNVDPVEAHGFAVDRYFPPSNMLTLSPNRCFDVKFKTDKVSAFRVYCWIPCSIHQLMQNGVLYVNP